MVYGPCLGGVSYPTGSYAEGWVRREEYLDGKLELRPFSPSGGSKSRVGTLCGNVILLPYAH